MTSRLQFLTFSPSRRRGEGWGKLKKNLHFIAHDLSTSPQLCPTRHAEHGTQRGQIPGALHLDGSGSNRSVGRSSLFDPLIKREDFGGDGREVC